MFLQPKKFKYPKFQRRRFSLVESRFNTLKFGKCGLIAQESAFISGRQIEATRKVINRFLKRKGKIWIRVFPDYPVSTKPTEIRMGKGKGGLDFWAARVRKGKILFEIEGVASQLAVLALLRACKKLPLKTFISSHII